MKKYINSLNLRRAFAPVPNWIPLALGISPVKSNTEQVLYSRTAGATSRPGRFVGLVTSLLVALLATIGTDVSGAGNNAGPPPVAILTPATGLGNGYIFVTPTGSAKEYANGPEILDAQGNVVWFHAIPTMVNGRFQRATDFRTQRYNGNQVLTWWQGAGFGGLSCGTDYIYDNHFNQIATVQAGNGLCADGHEFQISPWNTALITVFTEATADLTSIGGPANQTVINGIAQEIDIPTGKVLFQWNTADHVPYSLCEKPLPAKASDPWDWFHINSVHVDTDGTLLINSAATWATYKVDHSTGAIIWILGGKASSFTLVAAPGQVLDQANEIFSGQHDPVALGNGLYTYFDNETPATGPLLPYSRALVVQLDESARVATLVASYNQPEGLLSGSQGSAQATDEGNLFVGWGSLPYVSAFDPSGKLIFHAQFAEGVFSYRAYFLPFQFGK